MKSACSRAAKRLPGMGFILVTLLLSALALPRAALGRADLTTSNPPPGSIAPSGLTTITLTFSEPVSIDLTTARLGLTATGKQAPLTSQVDPADHRRLTVRTDPLPDGTYTVIWHAVSEIDHAATDGRLSFSVGASSAQGAAATPGASSPQGPNAQYNTADEPEDDDPAGPWITILVALVVVLVAALVVQTLWFRRRRGSP